MGTMYYVLSALFFAVLVVAAFIVPTQQDENKFYAEFDYQTNALEITNTGDSELSDFSVYVDGKKANHVSAPIPPGQKGKIFLTDTLASGLHSVEIEASGYKISKAIKMSDQSWVVDLEVSAE